LNYLVNNNVALSLFMYKSRNKIEFGYPVEVIVILRVMLALNKL